MVVARIKHVCQVACQVFFFYRLAVITLAECFQLEILHRLCIPDHQRVNHIVIIAYDWHVIWDGTDRLVIFVHKPCLAVRHVLCTHITAEFYLVAVFRPAQLERITVF